MGSPPPESNDIPRQTMPKKTRSLAKRAKPDFSHPPSSSPGRKNNMNSNTDKLVGDLKQVVNDAEDILRGTADDAGEKAREARERLVAAMEQARTSCRQLEEKALASARAADKIIRDHPYQSIGIAFGVGLLAGFLFTRK
jgi:ElaB/YqjD/DUF883 family membrane-anchored ribosome-binding protein